MKTSEKVAIGVAGAGAVIAGAIYLATRAPPAVDAIAKAVSVKDPTGSVASDVRFLHSYFPKFAANPESYLYEVAFPNTDVAIVFSVIVYSDRYVVEVGSQTNSDLDVLYKGVKMFTLTPSQLFTVSK